MFDFEFPSFISVGWGKGVEGEGGGMRGQGQGGAEKGAGNLKVKVKDDPGTTNLTFTFHLI